MHTNKVMLGKKLRSSDCLHGKMLLLKLPLLLPLLLHLLLLVITPGPTRVLQANPL